MESWFLVNEFPYVLYRLLGFSDFTADKSIFYLI